MVSAGNLLDKDSEIVAFRYFKRFRIVFLAATKLTVFVWTDEENFVHLHLNWQLVLYYDLQDAK